MENLTPVTLVIKAPNQKIADQTIECALDWTVRKLKQHLSSVYPSKPMETQQRIIYSGRLLQDDLQLKDVLRQYEPDQQTHTVHLVCSPTAMDMAAHGMQQQSHSQPTEPVAEAEGLRNRRPAGSTGQPTQPVNYSSPPVYGSVNMIDAQRNPFLYAAMPTHGGHMPPMSYSPEQLMWMQHAYYSQYMNQYMQYYHQQVGVLPQTHVMAQNEPANNVAANPLAGNAPRVEAVANERQRPEIVRMNAQGGPALNDDDDDEMNRDWLDWVYTFVRCILLLCILYFYSSFDRFLATMALVLLVYLYQAGWFQLNRRHGPAHRANAVARRAAPAARPQANDAAAAPQPNDDAQATPETNETTVGDAEQEVEPPRPGILAVTWTFFVSFFSSLAPQQPPPVNAN